MSSTYSILYAEDDKDLAQLYIRYFQKAGYRIIHTENGDAVYGLYKQHSPHILLLDLMLPGKNGFEITKQIRKIDKDIPIVIITSITDSAMAVNGFKGGVNDYVRKESSIEEVEVRLISHLQKSRIIKDIIRLTNDCSLDTQNQILMVGEIAISLSITEYRLFVLLYKNKDTIISRETIIEEIWGGRKVNAIDYLNKNITYLRNHLKPAKGIEIKSFFKRGVKLEIKE